MDGRTGVYLIAATNRPDIIDPALLRPGRLDKMLYVPLPDAAGRASILRALTRRTPVGGPLDLDALAASQRLEGFSGADLAAVVREACVAALKEGLAAAGLGGLGPNQAGPLVTQRHLEAAANRVQPSVSRRDRAMYERLRDRLCSARGHILGEVGGWVGERAWAELRMGRGYVRGRDAWCREGSWWCGGEIGYCWTPWCAKQPKRQRGLSAPSRIL